MGCFARVSLGLSWDSPMAEDLLESLKRRVDEQRRVLGSLASSLDEESRLDGLMRRVDDQCRVLESLASGGFSSGKIVI